MTKRKRTDSIDMQTERMAAAAKSIDPPDWCNVPAGALPAWRSIVDARATDRWNDIDLGNAAELARIKYDIERLRMEVADEGDIIKNDRGTPIVNPKHSLMESMTRRLVALSRMLQVHAEATQGKSRDQVKPNKAQAKAQEVMDGIEDDDLIAKPMH